MPSVWGRNIKICIFGESHGNEIGVTIDGFPDGLKPDYALIKRQLERRRPSNLGTSRREEDAYRIISGVYKDYTSGSPITVIFPNKYIAEYKNGSICRPSQSDYVAHIKYRGFNDNRSGGHFSARLTAPFVFAGSLAMQYLAQKGIDIGSHIYSVYNVYDRAFCEADMNKDLFDTLKSTGRLTLIPDIHYVIEEVTALMKKEKNSIGGIVEAAAIGLPTGVGSPFFNSLESDISSLLFSIPSVKGVEFGGGFALAGLKGSDANDGFVIENNVIKTKTNNSGGIQGGLSNGMPIIVRAAFKPVPSIGLIQDAYDCGLDAVAPFASDSPSDTCAVLRAAPCVESALCLAILDNILF